MTPAPSTASTDLVLVRHGPTVESGWVSGRRDIPLATLEAGRFEQLRSLIGRVDHVVSSPAQRCVATAAALLPAIHAHTDARLWEQSFGAWEGRHVGEVPDLGSLSLEELAAVRPPGGESFCDVAARTLPALRDLCTIGKPRIAVVAHAGTIRAALGLALGGRVERGLSFQIDLLSATMVRFLPDDQFAIAYVNRIA